MPRDAISRIANVGTVGKNGLINSTGVNKLYYHQHESLQPTKYISISLNHTGKTFEKVCLNLIILQFFPRHTGKVLVFIFHAHFSPSAHWQLITLRHTEKKNILKFILGGHFLSALAISSARA